MACWCDKCGKDASNAAIRVVCDCICYPPKLEPFRFTYRLCRWCRAAERRRANSGRSSLKPLIALDNNAIAAVDDEAIRVGILTKAA